MFAATDLGFECFPVAFHHFWGGTVSALILPQRQDSAHSIPSIMEVARSSALDM